MSAPARIRARRAAALAVLAAALALPAAALADHDGERPLFQPPEGCEAFLTVQMRQCSVLNFWRCAADAPGVVHFAEFDAHGAATVATVDREFRWLETRYLRAGITERLVEPEPDPASVSTLLETGRDDYDFELERTEEDGTTSRVRVRGTDRLLGRRTEVDGEPLELTGFELTVTGPEGTEHARGTQFLSRGLRLFFSGVEVWEGPDGTRRYFDGPASIRRPGEAGFGEVIPREGCKEEVSALPARPAAAGKEASHGS